jgi:L-alanine-DL-glutamate epimerase-like enolase superfamily enzyme
MRIEAVDFFYLSMPEVKDVGDGSQDALVVRVRGAGLCGWGECEASPLTSIASLVCPMSHSACKAVQDAVLGEELNSPADISRISRKVAEGSADLLQAAHTLSGIDIALWDLLGNKLEAPVYRLLGFKRAFAKVPYASQLFGDTAEQTHARAVEVAGLGYQAAKFGWGPYGRGSTKQDREQVFAAREGLGPDVELMVDAGMAFGEDDKAASRRLKDLKAARVYWLEEPFANGALYAYRALSRAAPRVPLAGGEGCHSVALARNMIDYAGVRFIQIDAGRIGGITAARQVAQYAVKKKVTYVNHTFTTALALSASLQPYAGLASHRICEFPFAPSSLAREIYQEKLGDGGAEISLPDRPGLGITPDLPAMRNYLVPTEITVRGKVVYRTPALEA